MTKSAHKDVQKMVEACLRQGWRVEHGARHWILWPADPTQPPATVGKSPNGAAIRNIKSDLRRRGAILP